MSGLPFVFHRAGLPAPFACTGRSAIRLASINLCAQLLRLGGARQHNLHMAKNNKDAKPEPRLPKGLRDIEAAELRQQQDMLGKIRAVYERYGFEPLETPAFEYTDALGKFLPDQDRPNEGVFSLQDEDEQWLSAALRPDRAARALRGQNFADAAQALPPLRRRPGVAQREAGAGPLPPVHAVRRRYGRGPTTSPRMPRSACWRRTRWRRWASSAATT